MTKALTLGFAVLAVIATLFSGIVAAADTKTSTQITGTSPGIPDAAGIGTLTGTTNQAGIIITPAITLQQVAGFNTVTLTGVMPANKEDVQLSNLGSTTVNLDGFSLSVDSGDQFKLPSTILAPGDDVIVYFGNGVGSDGTAYLNNEDDNVLNDASGTVTLSNLDGDRISSLSYDNVYRASAPGSRENAAPSSSAPSTSTHSS